MTRTARNRLGVDETALSAVPALLSGFTPEQEQHILQFAEHRKFRANRLMIKTGEPAEQLFLLTRGRAKYYRVTKKGEEVLLFWLTPGCSFGIGTLLAWPIHYIGTVQAVEDCEVAIWGRDTIRSLAATNKRLAENALHVVLHAVAVYTDRVVGLATGTAEERLAQVLLRLGQRIGHVRPDGVELAIMNEQLAGLANVSTFTASRQLKEWERQGLIQKRRGRVLILAPERLLID